MAAVAPAGVGESIGDGRGAAGVEGASGDAADAAAVAETAAPSTLPILPFGAIPRPEKVPGVS